MSAAEQPAEPKAKRRWFRSGRWMLLVLLLLVVSPLFIVVGLALCWRPPPLWQDPHYYRWIDADYGTQRYNQISRAIEADPNHFSGKPLDDLIRELNLEDVHWNSWTIQARHGTHVPFSGVCPFRLAG